MHRILENQYQGLRLDRRTSDLIFCTRQLCIKALHWLKGFFCAIVKKPNSNDERKNIRMAKE